MSTTGNRRSTMVLYADPAALSSHWVRLVIAEKDIKADIIPVDANQPPADLAEINPQRTVPTLIDRDLILYDARVIIDYLDERYPHPPFMPIDPVSRARSRLTLYRIQSDWVSLYERLLAGEDTTAELSASLAGSGDVFGAMPYFLSEEYSLLDAVLLPLLWRLPQYGIKLSAVGKPVSDYTSRLFARPGFEASLTSAERDMMA